MVHCVCCHFTLLNCVHLTLSPIWLNKLGFAMILESTRSYCRCTAIFTSRGELRKVLFLALSVTFLFVCEISREPLNGFAPKH